jgi:hypothetical protein
LLGERFDPMRSILHYAFAATLIGHPGHPAES